MRFIPMHFGNPHLAAAQLDLGNALELPPTTGAKLLRQPDNIVDPACRGDDLNVVDLYQFSSLCSKNTRKPLPRHIACGAGFSLRPCRRPVPSQVPLHPQGCPLRT